MKFISFYVHKRFWSRFFSVNGSLIDDENVYERLKTSLFCVKVWLFQKSVFYRLKKFQIEYLKIGKSNGSEIIKIAQFLKILKISPPEKRDTI